MMRTQRGFTLVEMLVAVTVSALLVSLVYGAVRVGQRSAQALSERNQASEVMRIGWRFIHDALSQARSVDDPDNEVQQTSFYGMADRLAFVADLPAYVGTGGLSRITLKIRPSSDGDQLVLTRQLFDTSATGQDATIHSAVLVDEMDRLEIRYFGQPDRDSTPGWHPTWVDSDGLPNLVVVRVVPAHGNPWPTLTASPLTGVAALEDDDVLLDEDARFDDEEEE